MIDSLSQKMGIDFSSGQPVQKPIVDYNEAREFLVNYLGLPLKGKNDFENFMKEYMKQGQGQNQEQGQGTASATNAPDQNLPINNNFNPEMASKAFTQQPLPGEENTAAQTEGMASKGVGQELNNGIKAGV